MTSSVERITILNTRVDRTINSPDLRMSNELSLGPPEPHTHPKTQALIVQHEEIKARRAILRSHDKIQRRLMKLWKHLVIRDRSEISQADLVELFVTLCQHLVSNNNGQRGRELVNVVTNHYVGQDAVIDYPTFVTLWLAFSDDWASSVVGDVYAAEAFLLTAMRVIISGPSRSSVVAFRNAAPTCLNLKSKVSMRLEELQYFKDCQAIQDKLQIRLGISTDFDAYRYLDYDQTFSAFIDLEEVEPKKVVVVNATVPKVTRRGMFSGGTLVFHDDPRLSRRRDTKPTDLTIRIQKSQATVQPNVWILEPRRCVKPTSVVGRETPSSSDVRHQRLDARLKSLHHGTLDASKRKAFYCSYKR